MDPASYRFYAIIIKLDDDREIERDWTYKKAVDFTTKNKVEVAGLIRKLVVKSEDTLSMEHVHVKHIRGNCFDISIPPSIEWPSFYFADDQHNQNETLMGNDVIVELGKTPLALKKTLKSVYT